MSAASIVLVGAHQLVPLNHLLPKRRDQLLAPCELHLWLCAVECDPIVFDVTSLGRITTGGDHLAELLLQVCDRGRLLSTNARQRFAGRRHTAQFQCGSDRFDIGNVELGRR